MTAIGILGAIMLSLCGVPQAWLAYRDGHARGVSAGMIALWGGGTVLMLVYVLARYADAALVANYLINGAVIGVICRFKWWPR